MYFFFLGSVFLSLLTSYTTRHTISPYTFINLRKSRVSANIFKCLSTSFSSCCLILVCSRCRRRCVVVFFCSFLCCSWLFHKYNIPSCFFLDIVLFIFFAFRLAVFVCFFPSHHAFCLLYAFFFAATAAAATVCKF